MSPKAEGNRIPKGGHVAYMDSVTMPYCGEGRMYGRLQAYSFRCLKGAQSRRFRRDRIGFDTAETGHRVYLSRTQIRGSFTSTAATVIRSNFAITG